MTDHYTQANVSIYVGAIGYAVWGAPERTSATG